MTNKAGFCGAALLPVLLTRQSMLSLLLEGCVTGKRLISSGEIHRVLFGKATPTVTAVIKVIPNENNSFPKVELPMYNQRAGEMNTETFFSPKTFGNLVRENLVVMGSPVH